MAQQRHTYTDERRVISVSRRTDVPAFFSEWFMNRIRAGVVAVPNPNNADQVSWVSLEPSSVSAFVFWTKDPEPMLKHLDVLDELGYLYYFQYTITAYPRHLEPHSPSLGHSATVFRELVGRLGRSRVIWRYDPIFFTERLDEKEQVRRIGEVADALGDAVGRLVVSFLDVYRRTEANMRLSLHGAEVWQFPRDWAQFAGGLGEVVRSHGLHLQTCAEAPGVVERLAAAGAVTGRCVDPALLEELLHGDVDARKDTGQRDACGCVRSREIGMYDSCQHGCAYCYANVTSEVAIRNARAKHDPASATLLGYMSDDVCPEHHSKPGGDGSQLPLFPNR